MLQILWRQGLPLCLGLTSTWGLRRAGWAWFKFYGHQSMTKYDQSMTKVSLKYNKSIIKVWCLISRCTQVCFKLIIVDKTHGTVLHLKSNCPDGLHLSSLWSRTTESCLTYFLSRYLATTYLQVSNINKMQFLMFMNVKLILNLWSLAWTWTLGLATEPPPW